MHVATPDGLRIAVHVTGNPHGPELLFIHGFSQSHLAWGRQIHSSLAATCKLVTYDLRGHGGSSKPDTPDSYQDPAGWAAELHAVMDAAGLRRPVLIGWSYAGRVIANYLAIYGPTRLAGLFLAAAATSSEPQYYIPETRALIAAMGDDDLATNIAATRAFLRACFHEPPADFETMLAFNMVVPPTVRRHMQGRHVSIDAFDVGLPLHIAHGEHDTIIRSTLARATAAAIPHATLSLYPCGHAPFYECPTRFNAELAEFVSQAR